MTVQDAVDVAYTRHSFRANYSFMDGYIELRIFSSVYSPSSKVDLWNPMR